MVTSATNSSSARPTVDGLVSGIQSSTIIDALVNSERASTRLIENRKTLDQGRLDAVRSFNAKLLSAQLDLSSLKQTSTFGARQAVSNNTEALTISKAGTSAIPGSYLVSIENVATAAQKSTAGQTSADAALLPGSVSLQIGSGPATQLTFSSGGSLNDIAAAINNAGIGVNASVVNDGTANPYRLVLRGEKTGLENNLIVTPTAGLSSLFSNMTELSAPANAKVKIGNNVNFIEVEQASNTFNSIVPGVDFIAVKPAANVNITVSADTAVAKTAITKFVDSLNTAVTYLKTNATYDPATKTGGVLMGQSSVISGLNRLMSTVTGSVAGRPSSLNALSAIGIRLDQATGTLSVDKTALEQKLSSDPDSVMRLFNNSGTSTNPAVQFAYLNEKTQVGGAFAVNITQPPLQAVVSSTAIGGTTVIDGSNNSLSLTINNHPIRVTLTNKSYSRDELAQHVNALINAAVTSQGDNVTVSLAGNRLDLRTNQYGHTQSIEVNSLSTALTALGLSGVAAIGTDVAGTINGIAGAGNGKVLIGAAGSAADGLSLTVTSAVPVSGVSVTVNKGLAQLVSERFGSLTNNTYGSVATADKTLSGNINTASKSITKADALLELRRQRLSKQFLAMEKLIQGFKSQGDAMTGFVNALTKNNG